ncbi:MAG: class I SAM-dependent methyltransferase [Candidatus Acidiferrales bacterium]
MSQLNSADSTPLAKLLAERIREGGPITFAEYMAECLYHPQFGFYSRADTIGRKHYYTSVEMHPIFGQLIARQTHEMWQLMERPEVFSLIELGAGDGALAAQILDFVRSKLPDFYSALSYTAIEISAARRASAAGALSGHIKSGKLAIALQPPGEIPAGCVLSNEFFDALPVHRVVQYKGELQEVFVGLAAGRFCEELLPPSTPEIIGYLESLGIKLREGQQGEISLEACRVFETVGRRLARGYVLTIDYGHESGELFNERHMRGTVLAYGNHRSSEDFYRAPGEQDLTSHVNFCALDVAGRRAGLARVGIVSQGNFLLALARRNNIAGFFEDGASEPERIRARLKFKSLIYPEGMGETFQVLVQEKGVGPSRLSGLSLLSEALATEASRV